MFLYIPVYISRLILSSHRLRFFSIGPREAVFLSPVPPFLFFVLLGRMSHFLLSCSIFVAFVLEAFFVEYSVEKSDLQTSLERKIEELELAVAQYVSTTPAGTSHTCTRRVDLDR